VSRNKWTTTFLNEQNAKKEELSKKTQLMEKEREGEKVRVYLAQIFEQLGGFAKQRERIGSS